MRFLGYLLLAIGLLYALLFWQFPYDRVQTALSQSLVGIAPVELTVSRVRPGFPFHLRLEGFGLKSGPFHFQGPTLSLHPDLRSLLGGRLAFRLAGKGHPRPLEGELWFTEWLGKDRGGLTLRLERLPVRAFSGGDLLFPGRLSGEASFRWRGKDFGQGQGQAWALLEREEGESPEPHPSPVPPFETLRLEVRAEGGAFTVKRLELSGKNFLPSGNWFRRGPAKG